MEDCQRRVEEDSRLKEEGGRGYRIDGGGWRNTEIRMNEPPISGPESADLTETIGTRSSYTSSEKQACPGFALLDRQYTHPGFKLFIR